FAYFGGVETKDTNARSGISDGVKMSGIACPCWYGKWVDWKTCTAKNGFPPDAVSPSQRWSRFVTSPSSNFPVLSRPVATAAVKPSILSGNSTQLVHEVESKNRSSRSEREK